MATTLYCDSGGYFVGAREAKKTLFFLQSVSLYTLNNYRLKEVNFKILQEANDCLLSGHCKLSVE